MTDKVQALVETWRRRASENGAIYAQGIAECADELEAALRPRGAPTAPADWSNHALACPYCKRAIGWWLEKRTPRNE